MKLGDMVPGFWISGTIISRALFSDADGNNGILENQSRQEAPPGAPPSLEDWI